MQSASKKTFESEVTTPQSGCKPMDMLRTRTEEKVRKTSHVEGTNESQQLRQDVRGKHKRKTSSTDKRMTRINTEKNLLMQSLEQ